MAKVSLTSNVVMDGGCLVNDVVFNDTTPIPSLTALNPRHREVVTIYCYTPINAGSISMYDVDEKGNYVLIASRAVAADTMLIYTHAHVCHGIYCIFTPVDSEADDTDYVRVRALFGGSGLL